MALMKSFALLAMTISSASAFAPTFGIRTRHHMARYVVSEPQSTPEKAVETVAPPTLSTKSESTSTNNLPVVQEVAPKQPKKHHDDHHGKQGIFSPLVFTLKKTLGDEELNKLRGKVITLHSEAIASFVSTAKTPFGQKTLEVLFKWADQNKDGVIEESELSAALHSLGFTWLQEKQVEGILQRADADDDGDLDLDEFKSEAPRTLKRGLTKLAKKNGGDLGFLS